MAGAIVNKFWEVFGVNQNEEDEEVQKLKAQWRKEGYDSITISKCNKLDVIATNPEYIRTFIDIGLKIREYYYRKYNNYLIRNKDRVS